VTGRKAVVIFVPFKLLKVVHKIQSRLVREVRTSARTRARHAQALHCATATSSDAEQQPRHLSRMSEDSVAAAAAAALQRGTAASVRCKAPASQDRAAAMRIAQRWVAAVAALRRQQQRKWLMPRRNASFPPGRTATCVASAHVAARAAWSGGMIGGGLRSAPRDGDASDASAAHPPQHTHHAREGGRATATPVRGSTPPARASCARVTYRRVRACLVSLSLSCAA
jgi:hypothetical protein